MEQGPFVGRTATCRWSEIVSSARLSKSTATARIDGSRTVPEVHKRSCKPNGQRTPLGDLGPRVEQSPCGDPPAAQVRPGRRSALSDLLHHGGLELHRPEPIHPAVDVVVIHAVDQAYVADLGAQLDRCR